MTTSSNRLVSLDFFRGATIVLMILVNNPGTWGAVYPPLLHAKWHGWTPTDLVFPFFLFIVGVAIVLAFTKRINQGVERRQLLNKAASRSAVLFALGLFLAAWPFFTFYPEFAVRPAFFKLRYMGVLQRIALCYFAASAIFLFARERTQLIWLTSLLVFYWLAVALIPVPGYGAGQLADPVGTLPAYLDRLIFGANHLWAGAGREWDPEGLASTLPAIGTTLFGVWTGQLLVSNADHATKTARMLVRGFALIAVGYVWSWFFPINKSLWTSSYAVFTAGQAMCCLGICYWVVDVKGLKRWTQPFVEYGVNAITVFFMSGIVAKSMGLIKLAGPDGKSISLHGWIYNTIFAPLGPAKLTSLLFAITWVLIWYLILHQMYKRNIIVKV